MSTAAPPETRSQRPLFRVLQQLTVPPNVLKVSRPAHKAIYLRLWISLIPYLLTYYIS